MSLFFLFYAAGDSFVSPKGEVLDLQWDHQGGHASSSRFVMHSRL